MAVTVLVQLVLVPRYGAEGAAVGACAGLLFHNCLKQVGLRMATGIRPFEARYRSTYVAIVSATFAILAAHWLMPDKPLVVLAVAGVESILLMLMSKHVLRISDVFPEVRRVPLVGALLA